MFDRACAVITLGGVVTLANLPQLLAAIATDNPSCDWDGPPFEPADILPGLPLTLVDNAAAFGQFATIESCCHNLGLEYRRWHDGAPTMGPTRQVFTGKGEARTFAITTDDELMLSMETIRSLGSFEALEAYAATANATVAPLRVVDATGQPVNLVEALETGEVGRAL